MDLAIRLTSLVGEVNLPFQNLRRGDLILGTNDGPDNDNPGDLLIVYGGQHSNHLGRKNNEFLVTAQSFGVFYDPRFTSKGLELSVDCFGKPKGIKRAFKQVDRAIGELAKLKVRYNKRTPLENTSYGHPFENVYVEKVPEIIAERFIEKERLRSSGGKRIIETTP